jgi:hypothetical protein
MVFLPALKTPLHLTKDEKGLTITPDNRLTGAFTRDMRY